MGRPEPRDQGGDKDPFTVFRPEVFEPDLRSMTRIVLRPIGSPMPLGFFTVAIDSALVSDAPDPGPVGSRTAPGR